MSKSVIVGLVLGLAGGVGAQPILNMPSTVIVVKDSILVPPNVKKRKFKWRTSTKPFQIPAGAPRIVPPAPGGPGDPTIHGATLIVYNAAGRPLSSTFALPAENWVINGSVENFKGYRFKDDTVIDGPVLRIYVKFDKLFVFGGRDNWTYLLDGQQQVRMAGRLIMVPSWHGVPKGSPS